MTKNAIQGSGLTLTKCKVECCDKDKCNTAEQHENAGYLLNASFTATLMFGIASVMKSFY